MLSPRFEDRALELRSKMVQQQQRLCMDCGRSLAMVNKRRCRPCRNERLGQLEDAMDLRRRIVAKSRIRKKRPSTSKAKLAPSMCRRLRRSTPKTRYRLIHRLSAERGVKVNTMYNWLHRHGGPIWL